MSDISNLSPSLVRVYHYHIRCDGDYRESGEERESDDGDKRNVMMSMSDCDDGVDMAGLISDSDEENDSNYDND